MQKIISLFERDWDGDRGKVLDKVTAEAVWVVDGEGLATVMWDGTAALYQDGILWKRYTVKGARTPPEGWMAAQGAPDERTGQWPGWVPVGEGKSDEPYVEAFMRRVSVAESQTYELIGPKVQGNPYTLGFHLLHAHGFSPLPNAPRTFDALREYLTTHVIEGIVWHHKDGRMVKIKARDFGLEWPRKETK